MRRGRSMSPCPTVERWYGCLIDVALTLSDVYMESPTRHTRAMQLRENRAMNEVFGLFPTPVMRAPATLGRNLVRELIDHFSALATGENNRSANLTHTKMLQPGDSP